LLFWFVQDFHSLYERMQAGPRIEQGGSELLLSRDDAEMARYISRRGMSE
jgi:hypothetical protein